MDYDSSEIAAVYDEARSVVPQTLRQWRDLLSEHIDLTSVSLVVDLGCGTGRFSEMLAGHFDAEVLGIDPSQKMLDRARAKLTSGKVALLRGSADALPLKDGLADLAMLSMVYHHLADPVQAARECHRVLRDGGCLCIRNTTREADFPHRHFFPGMQRLIDSQLPSRAEVVGTFSRAGFTVVADELIIQVIALDWPSFVRKSALRADSFLARLSDEDFRNGMAALTHGAGVAPDAPVTEEIGWFVFEKRD